MLAYSTWQLVQITLYHQEACEAVDEDSLLELVDWGYRKLLSLNAKHHKQARGESRVTCLHRYKFTNLTCFFHYIDSTYAGDFTDVGMKSVHV